MGMNGMGDSGRWSMEEGMSWHMATNFLFGLYAAVAFVFSFLSYAGVGYYCQQRDDGFLHDEHGLGHGQQNYKSDYSVVPLEMSTELEEERQF